MFLCIVGEKGRGLYIRVDSIEHGIRIRVGVSGGKRDRSIRRLRDQQVKLPSWLDCICMGFMRGSGIY